MACISSEVSPLYSVPQVGWRSALALRMYHSEANVYDRCPITDHHIKGLQALNSKFHGQPSLTSNINYSHKNKQRFFL